MKTKTTLIELFGKLQSGAAADTERALCSGVRLRSESRFVTFIVTNYGRETSGEGLIARAALSDPLLLHREPRVSVGVLRLLLKIERGYHHHHHQA